MVLATMNRIGKCNFDRLIAVCGEFSIHWSLAETFVGMERKDICSSPLIDVKCNIGAVGFKDGYPMLTTKDINCCVV